MAGGRSIGHHRRMTDLIALARDLQRGVVHGRDVVCVTSALAGATPWVEWLDRLGARRQLVVAVSRGTGPVPDPDMAESFVLGFAAPTMSAEIHALDEVLARPSPALVAALDRFDPERAALVLLPPYSGGVDEVAGRATYGARRAEWAALEDKTLADELFDAAAITRPPSRVVPVTGASGLDSVWSGDTREGFNGGAEFVRWVRDEADAARAREFFASHCDRVRIAPFLDGVPCSIHGFVCDDGVAVFRPVEMVVLRRPADHHERARFVYAGMSTIWDPEPADRAEMRDAARRMGDLLAARVAYRGAFTIDGVMTAHGFRPTEMNPRFGGALGYAVAAVPALGLALLQHIVVAADGAAVRAAELEAVVVAGADETRWVRCHTVVAQRIDESAELTFDGGRIEVGPATVGGLVRVDLDPDCVVAGSSVAPAICAAFARADAELGTMIGPVVPAVAAPARS